MPINLDEIEFLPLGEESQQPEPPVVEDKEDTDINNTDIDLEDNTDEDVQDQNIDDKGDTDDTNPSDDNDTEESLYKGLIESVGLELEEDELNEILSIDETDEGFASAATKIADKLAQKKLDDILERHPHTKNLFKFESNGGNADEFFDVFFPEVDYSKVEVTETDVDLQKDIIVESLKTQGFSEDDVAEIVEDYENGGLLYKQATRSLKLLQSHQAKMQEDFTKRQEALEREKEKAIKEERDKVNEIITNKDIRGIKIPESKIKSFEEYLYKPITEDGLSQAVIDSREMDLENRLLVAYLQMNKFDLADLVKIQSNNSKVRSLRDSLKNTDKIKNKNEDGSTGKYEKNPDIANLELF